MQLRKFQKFFNVYRHLTYIVHVPLTVAQERLHTAFLEDIVLSGTFQSSRRYRGQLNNHHFKLEGPFAYRQFCFQVEGIIQEHHENTQFEATIVLRDQDMGQLMVLVLFLFGIIIAMFRWGFILMMPFYLAFLYGMVQWHCERATDEIKQLLINLMSSSSHNH